MPKAVLFPVGAKYDFIGFRGVMVDQLMIAVVIFKTPVRFNRRGYAFIDNGALRRLLPSCFLY